MNFSKSFLLINSFSYYKTIHKSEGVSVRAFVCVKNGGGCYGLQKMHCSLVKWYQGNFT